jgi:dTDP-4-amino-4,6-dideoxygalactose transaminase
MIPRFRPELGLAEVLAALRPSSVEDVARFETAFATEMGQRHAIAFPYGRTGLMLLLEALGLSGKEIICPAYTCVVVPHAIVKSGNRPLFVDSRESDCNMDLDLAEAAIGPNTGALIATSIFGHPVDLDRLDVITARHPNLVIIQDCAHSYAAEWRGRPVQQAGRASIFGINISKTATSIFGGMVTTDDADLATRLRELRKKRLTPAPWQKSLARMLYLLAVMIAFQPVIYSLVRRLERGGWLDRFSRYYDEGVIDLPADALIGLTSVEARVGLVQIRKYRAMVAARRKWAAYYYAALRDCPGLSFPVVPEGTTWSHIVAEVAERDELLRGAERRGVQLGVVIDYNIPEMKAYRGSGDCPISSRFSRHMINLPLGGAYCERHARKAARVVAQWLEQQPPQHDVH